MRIAVIADTHLAERAPECVANWRAAASAVSRLGVDLTVHLGDISLDGQTRPEELRFAADLARSWPTPLSFVPGNHDLGDGSGEAPLDPSRVAAYTASFGADRWAVRAGRWELVGLDAQLFGSGTPEEQAQWEWLEERVRGGDQPEHRALFLHRPVVRPNAAEHARAGRYVPQAACARLLEGPLRGTLRVVLSGHTHQHLDRTVAGVRHLWVPSTAFILPDALQVRVGEKVVGLGVLELSGAAACFDLLCPEGMLRHDVTALGFHAGLHAHGAHASEPLSTAGVPTGPVAA